MITDFNLNSHVALYSLSCSECGGDIDIGDDCWIDTSDGTEEHQAKIYCVNCVEN